MGKRRQPIRVGGIKEQLPDGGCQGRAGWLGGWSWGSLAGRLALEPGVHMDRRALGGWKT